MNRIIEEVSQHYERIIQQWDQEHGIDPTAENVVERRLNKTSILLIVSGEIGCRTAERLAQLPLGQLSIYPLRPSDVERLKLLREGNMPIRAKRFAVYDFAFGYNGLSVILQAHHMIGVITGRPFPELLQRTTEMALNMGRIWFGAHQWGSDLTVLPMNLPGVTACYHCYQRRYLANAQFQDVEKAMEYFWCADKQFEFAGQNQSLLNSTSAFITAQIQQFFAGQHEPRILNRVLRFNPLASLIPLEDYVLPLAWCPVCQHTRSKLRAWDTQETLNEVARKLCNPQELIYDEC